MELRLTKEELEKIVLEWATVNVNSKFNDVVVDHWGAATVLTKPEPQKTPLQNKEKENLSGSASRQ